MATVKKNFHCTFKTAAEGFDFVEVRRRFAIKAVKILHEAEK
jgi:hypothetical protein